MSFAAKQTTTEIIFNPVVVINERHLARVDRGVKTRMTSLCMVCLDQKNGMQRHVWMLAEKYMEFYMIGFFRAFDEKERQKSQ